MSSDGVLNAGVRHSSYESGDSGGTSDAGTMMARLTLKSLIVTRRLPRFGRSGLLPSVNDAS